MDIKQESPPEQEGFLEFEVYLEAELTLGIEPVGVFRF